jgi:hypothetical protein
MRNPITWHPLVKAALPYFGNDMAKVVWEADVRQLFAIAHAELGNPGDGVDNRRARAVENQAFVERLKELKR